MEIARKINSFLVHTFRKGDFIRNTGKTVHGQFTGGSTFHGYEVYMVLDYTKHYILVNSVMCEWERKKKVCISENGIPYLTELNGSYEGKPLLYIYEKFSFTRKSEVGYYKHKEKVQWLEDRGVVFSV